MRASTREDKRKESNKAQFPCNFNYANVPSLATAQLPRG